MQPTSQQETQLVSAKGHSDKKKSTVMHKHKKKNKRTSESRKYLSL